MECNVLRFQKLLVILRFLVLLTLVLQQVKSQRLVVNTTCLELAKPSNQQLRLSCGDPDQYHCLLDESNTREFEFCSDWKWIPEGNHVFISMIDWLINLCFTPNIFQPNNDGVKYIDRMQTVKSASFLNILESIFLHLNYERSDSYARQVTL